MAFTNFGPYAYRAWAAKDPLSTGPWSAWYEIHTPDHQTLLFGPTKLPDEFAMGDDAVAAAEARARREISHNIGSQPQLAK